MVTNQAAGRVTEMPLQQLKMRGRGDLTGNWELHSGRKNWPRIPSEVL
jgi:hypothetical protein